MVMVTIQSAIRELNRHTGNDTALAIREVKIDPVNLLG